MTELKNGRANSAVVIEPSYCYLKHEYPRFYTVENKLSNYWEPKILLS
jgi:hypothetical protein